jgi:tRNA(Ile)-lysidine synthetase-like protein
MSLSKQDKVFMANTRKRVGKAIYKYKLIEKNDTVLVAVSGGKDSLFLLEALAMQRKQIPFDFNIKAIHIEVNNIDSYKINKKYLQNLCDEYNIPLHYKSVELRDLEENDKSPCFICSWTRRTELFKATKEYNCNKLALGHHMTDAIETLMLNMTFHGNISSMPASLEMFNGEFSIIRPMILLEEDNIYKYAKFRDYPKEVEACPFENNGKRFKMKSIISSLKNMNKNAEVNIFRSMSKIDFDYLP